MSTFDRIPLQQGFNRASTGQRSQSQKNSEFVQRDSYLWFGTLFENIQAPDPENKME